jgi:hypothetical protein
MYSLDFKTVDQVVYRRDNSSVEATFGHDELAKIRSRPAGPFPALNCRLLLFFTRKRKLK